MDLDTIKMVLIFLIVGIILISEYGINRVILQKVIRKKIKNHEKKSGDMRMYLSSRDYIRWNHLIQKNIWTKEEYKSMVRLFSKGVLFLENLDSKDPATQIYTIQLVDMWVQFEVESHIRVVDLINGNLKQKWLNEVNFVEECHLPIIANCLIDAINQYHKMDTSHG